MEGIPDIQPFRGRRTELDLMMSQPDYFSDPRRAKDIAREHAHVSNLIRLYDRLDKLEHELVENRSLARDSSAGPELRELAAEEVEAGEAKYDQYREELLLAMLPPDPTDSRNTIVEIRGGAGGDEGNIFAGDLFRMYQRLADREGWKIETMGMNESEMGGFREVAFLISGEDVFKKLKYESGVHRVQRVPATENQGRIHTSTATVAVLPEAEEVDVEIRPDDLVITTCRASGAGGQHVNKTESAVQLTHTPSGIMVYCADERSQIKNRAKAMKVLRSRLLERKQKEESDKYAQHRRNQIGTGDRSERIRTYNFPQSRLTDHRIGLTVHSLTAVMDGELDEVIEALTVADSAARLKALLAENTAHSH